MRKKNVNQKIKCNGYELKARLFRVIENKDFKIYQLKIKNISSWKRLKVMPHSIFFQKRDLNQPILKHISSEIIEPKKSIILTLLVDRYAKMKEARVCDMGSQVILINAKKKKGKSG